MPLGEHWEWRGFGSPTDAFLGRFESLEPLYPPRELVDRYLWLPGATVNVKLREGFQEGLKLKRRLEEAEGFERWLEDPAEVFEFPLGPRAWGRLAAALGLDTSRLPEPPARPTHLDRSLEILRGWRAGIRVIEVAKRRRSRILRTESGSAIVEWADIARPERTVSIGLEEWWDPGSAEPADPRRGLAVVREARRVMGLEGEALHPASYLDALETWARGGHVGIDADR